MTEALAIVGIAALFVAFALLQRHVVTGGCRPDDCDARDTELGCGGCRLAEEGPETRDVPR